MKFLLVSPFTSASGSAIRFWNIARALRDEGHDVVLADRKTRGGGRLHYCEGIRYHGCFSTGAMLPDIVISFFYYCFLLLKYRDCSVFYALKPAPNNCIPALLARVAGKKTLLDVDDLDYAYLGAGFGAAVFRRFFDFFPRFFHLVTYHTPNLAEYLREKARVPSERLHYLAQGVSPEFLADTSGFPAAVPPAALVYVATLGITSDFSDLVPGLRILCSAHPEISMSVIGDGCRKREFEELVHREGLEKNVSFLGTIPHHELPALLARHRIGINYMRPTEANRYRAILKIREYLSCGLDVVCNDVGDVELFRNHIRIASTIDAMFDSVASIVRKSPERNEAGRVLIEKEYRWPGIIAPLRRRIEDL